MMSRRILIPFVLAALIVPLAMAQDNTGGGNRDRGDRTRGGGPGGFDPAQIRQRALDRVKEQMGDVKEDEWKVIEAKLTPVMEKRFESLAAGFGGVGRGGRGGGGGDQPERPARNAVEQATRDLQKALDDKGASEDSIKAKLAAFREARDKVRNELASAQKELKEVVMPRQEAVLVAQGYLD
jgi:hypothetical protein